MTRDIFRSCACAVLLTAAFPPAVHAEAGPGADALSAFEGVWVSGPQGRAGAPDVNRDGPPPRRAGFGQRGAAGFAPPPGARRGPPAPVADGEAPQEIAHITGLDRGDLRTWREMTDAGRQAFAQVDPHDLPVNNCQPAGLPHIAGAPGLQDWRASDGGTLTITHEFSSAVRSIPPGDAVPDAPHSAMGDAVWRIEGDTLVIETANLTAAPGSLARNAPGSAARTVVERYRLSLDGRSLTGEMTITDPDYLTRPVTMPLHLSRAEPGVELEIFPCSVENARRYLN